MPPKVKAGMVPTLDGLPSAGVTNVGLVANTAEPVPVSSVKALAKLAELNEPSSVALPVDVTAPVKFAFVVTLPAVNPAAVPVMFVPIRADGVPRSGVTKVGEVLNTKLVEVVPVAPAAVKPDILLNAVMPALVAFVPPRATVTGAVRLNAVPVKVSPVLAV